MKKLFVMAAAAALLSGMSLANAQSSMTKPGDKTQTNAGTNAAFCLDVQGTKKCTFASMADCQKEAKNNGSCAANPNKATTGSGMSGSSTSSGGSMKK